MAEACLLSQVVSFSLCLVAASGRPNNSLEPCPKSWHAKPATRTAGEQGDSNAL